MLTGPDTATGAVTRRKTIGGANVADDHMLSMAPRLRDQEMSLRGIAARLVITTGKKKGRHPSPATVMRMLREHDEKAAPASWLTNLGHAALLVVSSSLWENRAESGGTEAARPAATSHRVTIARSRSSALPPAIRGAIGGPFGGSIYIGLPSVGIAAGHRSCMPSRMAQTGMRYRM
ncbi:hypothetical protein B4N89_47370 [Embleya scabrispora]|uniref:Uncharacterized protein n=1 Tax=Embleya scabrispora TaxID=159449 RepID=A0A1T3NHZ8_9ACTN|nr:hypothetical protein B4N89_47370 [Embleya scabrispora]